MAITSVGYDGTVNEVQWAKLARVLGAPYAILGANDWATTVVPGQERTISIAPGTGYGHGVMDTSDAPVTLQLPAVGTGSRWDLIMARRTWATNTTFFGYVNGTGTRALPTGRISNPGVQDDQPIALAFSRAGVPLVDLVDLRVYPQKVAFVRDLLALPDAPIGAQAMVVQGTENPSVTRYTRYISDGSSSSSWNEEAVLKGTTLSTTQTLNLTTQVNAPLTAEVLRYCPTGRVQVSVDASAYSSVANTNLRLDLDLDANVTALSTTRTFSLAGVSGLESVGFSRILDVTPGNHSFQLRGQRRAGTGTISVLGGAQLSIIDVRKA